LSALAEACELGPEAAYRVFMARREDIERIARWKVELLGVPQDNVIAVCRDDVRAQALLAHDAACELAPKTVMSETEAV
jgi:hypothetical protein